MKKYTYTFRATIFLSLFIELFYVFENFVFGHRGLLSYTQWEAGDYLVTGLITLASLLIFVLSKKRSFTTYDKIIFLLVLIIRLFVFHPLKV